jgi:hypothetical protein
MTVPAQLDMHATCVTDVAQRSQHGDKINFTLPEHQVLMNAFPHVLDMDVPKKILPFPQLIADGSLALAVKMANIDGQAEIGTIHVLAKLCELFHRIDEHAGFRLEGQGHFGLLRAVEHGIEGFG